MGERNVMECRVNTLVKIADSLSVNLLDLIHASLTISPKYNFIDSATRDKLIMKYPIA